VDLIGKTIKIMRREKKMSTYDLSRKTGISQSTISKLENGKKKADIELLLSISDALGTDINEILRRSFGYKHDEKSIPGVHISETPVCYDDTLTEDEIVAVKAFIETYRKIKADRKKQ